RAAAEEAGVGGAAAPGVGRDEGGVEVLDPLPYEAVHVPRPPHVAVGGADAREDGRAGAAVPPEEAAREAGLGAAVGARLAGGGGVLPLRRRREPLAGPVGVGARGEPRDVDDG